MINDVSISYLIFLMPLLTFVVNGLFLGRKSAKGAAIFAIICNGIAFASALSLAISYFSSGYAPQKAILFELPFLKFAETFVANIGLLVDPLSIMMLVVVTFIAFMVNIYSVGYMRGDRAEGRFFALLSLFSFSMLGLVAATNLFQMFIFWELVGVSSYLLIGFWYHKPSAVSASKQAFILTRFADSFFLFGIVLVSYVLQTFDFANINSISLIAFKKQVINLGIMSISQADALILGSIMIFTGGWGKSAMFPMHIWLPNAMEGPTPVSSIIHSATMVVAGVYLVARLFPFFAACGDALTLIMWVGAFTMVFAAVIACTQKDIKRILAYSTLSQLGYMMFSLGACKIGDAVIVTGWTASTFHIFTHAFFKCSLFLIAGSLIHQVHTNDLDAMGGLRKKMPITYICALISILAISGIPPFSGFFSKDEIILAAFQGHHYVVFGLALLTSGLTTFYMFRLFFLAFHGKPRCHSVAEGHVHEDFAMTLPIAILAIPALASGFAAKGLFEHFFVPGKLRVPQLVLLPEAHWIPVVAIGVAVLALLIAWFLYASPKAKIERALDDTNRCGIYKTIYHKFYFDEMYYCVVRQFVIGGIAKIARGIQDVVIEGLVAFAVWFVHKLGNLVRTAQSGNLTFYVGTLIVGIIIWRFIGNLPF
ncbi:NADH dehydrogenase subunit L [Fibrobacter sp. UWH9]|uniref:NADH-quinone oxidoreductase subunit L n=1 Tax=unclassified Fibrobacter TaxID=2634177 RepID=UPI00091C9CD4|nr:MULTISPECIES: NADH-quinone oxidoreductase subunit L [unclassified Fibrobacter]MCQ2099443.1 NADH-quinone oxidoreductase subunit L [Fibrobacter sp.]MDO4947683.1 NADH-quinone oxidoreductase subunit L [Fibrobacter sp.]OWV07221.1 NADH-quinone oxidoreductase subunit L [Fibrobacter sp. UWH3]OWV15842.1 NADH-quinone oxidoreductase subunit L [Fibrobacter sp. UWH1]SHG84012.1 NADH dehydrogenase subunit L [Fibrobacter sp. UWH9]